MEIDRRAFLASLGSVAVLESMDSEAKAEALEHYMMERLDEQAPAPPASPDPWRRGTGGLFTPPRAEPGEERKLRELPEMPAKPTLVDFYNLRFAPANHVLQSATRALKT